MKILFMGTPEFAVPSLETLLDTGHEVCAVFSQPDKAVGRHQNQLRFTPVKSCAVWRGIPVYQPAKLRDSNALEVIRAYAPDLIVVVAYGRILPKEILEFPPKGCINVHPSLLPKYRGAAPLNWPILNGDKETGVTIMYLTESLDAGDIISQWKTPLGPEETAPELTARLAVAGAGLLLEAVTAIRIGTSTRTPQDESQVTLAPMLSKELSPVDWNKSAQVIHDQIRGLQPWPAATAQVAGVRCKLFSSRVEEMGGEPGTVLEAGKAGIVVACGDGQALRLLELQPDGKNRMPADSFLAGHPLEVGKTL